jgi:IS5 family transposase
MHVLSDANGLPVLVGVSAGNAHDSEGLKPMVEGHQTRHDPHRGRHFKPQRLHADKAYDRAGCADGCEESASACGSPAKASSPAND